MFLQTEVHPRQPLLLAVSMLVSLVLLIHISFKIILFNGLTFTANSILCPVTAGLYLMAIHHCNIRQQRHILHISLLALYVFSVGIYLMVNLPAAAHLKDTIAYQIVFENIPGKFFASTLAFGLSFYLPHLYVSYQKPHWFSSPGKCAGLALTGGALFFILNFLLLFSIPMTQKYMPIYTHSILVSFSLLILTGLVYMGYIVLKQTSTLVKSETLLSQDHAFYQYLTGFSVTVLMICLACEYRLISIFNGHVLSASGIIFPFTLICSSLASELYGYKASWNLTLILIFSELVFDFLFMISVIIPSPDFFNLNPFFYTILPRRITATTLSLLLVYISNAWLIDKFQKSFLKNNMALRVFAANMLSNSLMCMVNYSILFAGVYPGEHVINMGFNSWFYKIIISVLSLPLILRICRR